MSGLQFEVPRPDAARSIRRRIGEFGEVGAEPSRRDGGYVLWPDPEDGPLEVHFIQIVDEGRLDTFGVLIQDRRGNHLNTSDLRKIPYDQLLGESRGKERAFLEWAEEHGPKGGQIAGALERQLKRLQASEHHVGTRWHDDDHWKLVTAVYDAAWQQNRPPVKAVAEKFVVSRSVAGKWVARCRDMGLLPTTVGKRARGNRA